MPAGPRQDRATLDERFARLDRSRWLPAYLPAWSSLADAAATWAIGAEGLTLSIPAGQPRWCPGLHDDPPLKVSAIQSGNRSGPVGSADAQQPFRPGLLVRQAQQEFRGFLFGEGRLGVECTAVIGPDQMFSAWLVGFEDAPERCGELCLVEVFGDAPTRVGTGVHPFRDPALHEEFSADERDIDVARRHRYTVEHSAAGTVFRIDGEVVRTSAQNPAYPMQLIVAVFEFPGSAGRAAAAALTVHRITADEAP